MLKTNSLKNSNCFSKQECILNENSNAGCSSIKKSRILFIFPNFATIGGNQPVGVASLLATLKDNGYKFDFFDTSFLLDDPDTENSYTGHIKNRINDVRPKSLEEVIKIFLKKFNPNDYDILMISSLSSTHKAALAFIDKIKSINPSIYTIVGGIKPTVAPTETIKGKGIDAICIGEGEEAIIELLERITQKKDFYDVKNF